MSRNARRITIAVLAAGTLLAGLTACAPGGTPGETTKDPTDGKQTTMPTDTTAKPGESSIVGTWTVQQEGNPELTFVDDGTVSGTDGCNGITAKYKVAGSEATLTQGATTLKACQGIDDWLSGVSKARVDGNTLHIFDHSGKEIGKLERKA